MASGFAIFFIWEVTGMSRTVRLILILTLALAACKAGRSDLTSLESPLSRPIAFDSPLPNLTVVDAATPVSQPPADLGLVMGTLKPVRGELRSVPLSGVSLYLAPLIHSTDGQSAMAKHNAKYDPKAAIDEAGRFVFPNVEPDVYALVYSSVISEFLVKEPGSNKDLLITVEAGQIADLGEIRVEIH